MLEFFSTASLQFSSVDCCPLFCGSLNVSICQNLPWTHISSVNTLTLGNHFYSCHFPEVCTILCISFSFLKLHMSKTKLLTFSPKLLLFSFSPPCIWANQKLGKILDLFLFFTSLLPQSIIQSCLFNFLIMSIILFSLAHCCFSTTGRHLLLLSNYTS